MSKWRPSPLNCYYVIPDIHGCFEALSVILERIIPLRKSDGGSDKIVFLGDYIDYHQDSHLVIDRLIELESFYKDKITFLLGEHEYFLLSALDLLEGVTQSWETILKTYNHWISNGGAETVLGYLTRAGITENPHKFPRNRIRDVIPSAHIDFFRSLKPYHETDDYFFTHAGIDPSRSLSEQNWIENLTDTLLFKKAIREKNDNDFQKTFVVGHHGLNGKKPIIYEKYMMLDSGSPKQLLIVELNSMEAFMAYPGQSKMTKFNLFKI